MAKNIANQTQQLEASVMIDLADCYAVCLETANYALELGGDFADPVRLKLIFDCADICQVASNFMFPTSNPARRVSAVCAQVCDNCAERCQEIEDDQFQTCAKVCRRAADSSRKMAGLEPNPR
jgi:hypothetical protein